jgi:hypothetical protein
MTGALDRAVAAVAMLILGSVAALAQDYSGRERLRAQSNEFRREVIQVTDGVYDRAHVARCQDDQG